MIIKALRGTLAGLPPGTYEVIVGLYDFEAGVRLVVEGSMEGTVALDAIEVTAE